MRPLIAAFVRDEIEELFSDNKNFSFADGFTVISPGGKNHEPHAVFIQDGKYLQSARIVEVGRAVLAGKSGNWIAKNIGCCTKRIHKVRLMMEGYQNEVANRNQEIL